jgi:hypothetical protein
MSRLKDKTEIEQHMNLEFLTSVQEYGLVDRYKSFGGAFCLFVQSRKK